MEILLDSGFAMKDWWSSLRAETTYREPCGGLIGGESHRNGFLKEFSFFGVSTPLIPL
jgi:hypothetical protein